GWFGSRCNRSWLWGSLNLLLLLLLLLLGTRAVGPNRRNRCGCGGSQSREIDLSLAIRGRSKIGCALCGQIWRQLSHGIRGFALLFFLLGLFRLNLLL